MFDSLSAGQKGDLWNNIETFTKQHGNIFTFGSMFAGSDLVVGVLNVLSELAEEYFAIKPSFRQRFLIEKDYQISCVGLTPGRAHPR